MQSRFGMVDIAEGLSDGHDLILTLVHSLVSRATAESPLVAFRAACAVM